MRFTYQINYGSGFKQINPDNNQAKLGIKRYYNPFIQRKYVSGSFQLKTTEYDEAYDYFFTTSSFEAPFRIYEGLELIFDGWCSPGNEYDIKARTMTISSFRVNDEYTAIENILTKTVRGEQINQSGDYISEFTIEGNNANCNKLASFTWNGTDYSLVGNKYDIGLVGRPSITTLNNKVIVFDDHTRTLRAFDFDGTDFTPSATGTLLDIGAIISGDYGHAAICQSDTNEVFLVLPGIQTGLYLTISGATWTYIDVELPPMEFPSIAKINSTMIACVDDLSKELRVINGIFVEPYNLGDVVKPKMTVIDTNYIAVIDERTQKLQLYFYSSSAFTVQGTAISIPFMADPSIVGMVGTGSVSIHDSYSGKIYNYLYDSGSSSWSLDGNSYSISGGYSSSIGYDGTYNYLLISDSPQLASRISPNAENIIDTILFNESLSDYDFSPTTSGCTLDVDNVFFGSMETLQLPGNSSAIDILNDHEYNLDELFKTLEIFQNYWYLQLIGGVYFIKFIQPNLFSSFGTDIDVSAYVNTRSQRIINDEYFINKEKLIFQNAYNSDFSTDYIDYGKNTQIIYSQTYSITNDFNLIIDVFYNRIKKTLSKSGLFMVLVDRTGRYYAPCGTSALGNTNVRNEALSTSRIYEDYMKDYRYADKGSFTLNGNMVSVQNTCRPIVNFPEVNFSLAAFPDSIASLDWGSGVKSYITDMNIDLNTYVFTAQSVKLDL